MRPKRRTLRQRARLLAAEAQIRWADMKTELATVIQLMERFVSGEEIGIVHARRLESALLEIAEPDSALDDLANALAQYSPGGGDHLFDYPTMRSRVTRQLSLLTTSADASMVEIELSRKLLERGHLNVPEHAILGNRVRFSVLVRLLDASLNDHPFFPTDLTPSSEFTGVLIERRGPEHWVHERHEISVVALSPTNSRKVASLGAALLLKIEEEGGVGGVRVDLNA